MTLLLVSLLFMIINIAPTGFTQLGFTDPAATAKFIGQGIIPVLAMSLFASYLAYLGGALSAIGYMGIIQAFEWYSPVLPDLDWAILALIGTIGPAIGFIIIQSDIQITHGRKLRKKKKDPAIAWAGVAIISLLIIFFSFGYFGSQPTTIISGSMSPNLEIGDIVLVSDVDVNEIEVGDIIQFQIGNMSIPTIHRVHEILEEGDNLEFITKGDANNNPDIFPVSPGQITGQVVFKIPKIGWISIGVKEMLNRIGINI
jgi:signal peptidase